MIGPFTDHLSGFAPNGTEAHFPGLDRPFWAPFAQDRFFASKWGVLGSVPRLARIEMEIISDAAVPRPLLIERLSRAPTQRLVGAVDRAVLRTICPALVRTVQRPVFRASIVCFRYRLFKIGFSRRNGGITVQEVLGSARVPRTAADASAAERGNCYGRQARKTRDQKRCWLFCRDAHVAPTGLSTQENPCLRGRYVKLAKSGPERA